ncbi:MAG: hypothetical protein ACRDCE_01570 [Cetobacterium sp.]|uniref:hypothetical protein n=1 Tax=Cetobacterium sp. TaxID=2071632 RepID=UPI003EE6A92A
MKLDLKQLSDKDVESQLVLVLASLEAGLPVLAEHQRRIIKERLTICSNEEFVKLKAQYAFLTELEMLVTNLGEQP